MTPVETVFHYGRVPGEAEMRALHDVKEVYGVRQLSPDSRTKSIRVEYDASRLSQNDVAVLLREAGIQLV